jgi:four helix bundle protein
LRAATSIGANVEEARDGESRADFIHKYSIAQKEAREARYWLRLMVRSRLASLEDVAPLQKECGELYAIITAIIRRAKGSA